MRTARRVMIVLLFACGTLLLGAVVRVRGSVLRPAPRAPLVLGPVMLRSGSTPVQRAYVQIDDGRIASVSGTPPPGQALFGDRFVIPGLIDAHVHLPPWFVPGQTDLFATLFLAHGVTTVRETGSFGSRPFALGDAITAGRSAGPRVIACGEVLDGDPPTWPLVRVVRDAAEAQAAVRDQIRRGARCIKVYGAISREALDAIRAEAHANRVPVVGHLPIASGFHEEGIDEIEHVCDPRCWEMNRRDVATLVGTAERAGIAHTPTLVVFEGQIRSYDYAANVASPLAQLMPRVWRDVVWNPRFRLGFTPSRDDESQAREALHRQMLASVCDAVAGLHSAGVTIGAGTDPPNPFVVPGASLHEELRALVRCGMTPAEALNAATRQAATMLGVPGLGRIEAGAPADLLVLREDPTRDLGALETLEAVVADGRLYERRDLSAALVRQQVMLSSWWIDGPTVVIARLVAESLSMSR
ncbi:MAG: hypothetical protein DCC71_16780 [Proteobacteria bacterium]|nr:MAG: hypothetical protein DCC71_16780 [Pseudomonadota bacterium]